MQALPVDEFENFCYVCTHTRSLTPYGPAKLSLHAWHAFVTASLRGSTASAVPGTTADVATCLHIRAQKFAALIGGQDRSFFPFAALL